MNKFNSFKNSSSEKEHSSDEIPKDNESKDQLEKVLCNHCGRTARNGIKCRGYCVADNDY